MLASDDEEDLTSPNSNPYASSAGIKQNDQI